MDFFRPTHPLNLENSRFFFFFFEPFPYLFIMFSPKEKIIPFISLFRSQKKQNKTVTCQLRVLCALCVVTTLIIVVVCGFLVAAFVKPSTFSFVSSLIGLNTVCQDLPGKLMFIK